MSGVGLGVASALGFAVSDFSGGLATRHEPALTVTAIGQCSAVVFVAALLLAEPATQVRPADVLGGAVGGVFLLGGLQCMYRVLARGPMGLLSAVVAVVSAIVPFAWAVAGGERLGAWQVVGAVVALLAVTVAAVAGGRRGPAAATRADVGLAVAAGALFGFSFVAVGRAPEAAALVPVLAMRATTAAAAVGLCLRAGALRPRSRRAGLAAVASGVSGTLGLALFVWAAHDGVASTVAVLQALAPLGVTVLAFAFLRQRITAVQAAGIGLAVASAALLAL